MMFDACSINWRREAGHQAVNSNNAPSGRLIAATLLTETISRGRSALPGPSSSPASLFSTPQKTKMSAIKLTMLIQAWFDVKPPAITVSSLTNRPNGGRPLTATAARPNNSAATGIVRTSPERSEEHTSELQSLAYLVCRLLLEKKKRLLL